MELQGKGFEYGILAWVFLVLGFREQVTLYPFWAVSSLILAVISLSLGARNGRRTLTGEEEAAHLDVTVLASQSLSVSAVAGSMVMFLLAF